MSKTRTEIDYDFRDHLYDTIVLLGGRKEIADLLRKSQDVLVTGEDVQRLIRYNYDLVTKAKDRLANMSTINVVSVD